jgi:hypothetical protein
VKDVKEGFKKLRELDVTWSAPLTLADLRVKKEDIPIIVKIEQEQQKDKSVSPLFPLTPEDTQAILLLVF